MSEISTLLIGFSEFLQTMENNQKCLITTKLNLLSFLKNLTLFWHSNTDKFWIRLFVRENSNMSKNKVPRFARKVLKVDSWSDLKNMTLIYCDIFVKPLEIVTNSKLRLFWQFSIIVKEYLKCTSLLYLV